MRWGETLVIAKIKPLNTMRCPILPNREQLSWTKSAKFLSLSVSKILIFSLFLPCEPFLLYFSGHTNIHIKPTCMHYPENCSLFTREEQTENYDFIHAKKQDHNTQGTGTINSDFPSLNHSLPHSTSPEGFLG